MNILDASIHWQSLADAEILAAETWAKRYGSVSTYYARAALYEKTAKSLALQHETGMVHCLCHLRPSVECPNLQDGGKILIRESV